MLSLFWTEKQRYCGKVTVKKRWCQWGAITRNLNPLSNTEHKITSECLSERNFSYLSLSPTFSFLNGADHRVTRHLESILNKLTDENKGKKYIPLVSVLKIYLLITIISPLKFYIAAAHYGYLCGKKVFYFCSIECSFWNCKAIFYFFYLLSRFFSPSSACYRILTLSLVVTMMSSSIWACQSSKSISGLLPGGILTSNFWTYYCLLPLGIL